MKKIFIQNLIITLSLIALSFPCNLVINHYAILMRPAQFIPIIIYALLCGAAIILMDLSDRRINAVFAGIYLIFSMVNIQIHSFFVHGPTVYWFILMFGALLTSILKPNQKEF